MFDDQDKQQNQQISPLAQVHGAKPRPPQPISQKEPLVSDVLAKPVVPGNLPIDDQQNEQTKFGQNLPEDIFAGPEEISELAASPGSKPAEPKADLVHKPEIREKTEQAQVSVPTNVSNVETALPTGAAPPPPLPSPVTRRKVLVFLLSALLVALLLIAGYLVYRIIRAKGQRVRVYNQPIENNNQIPNSKNQINTNDQNFQPKTDSSSLADNQPLAGNNQTIDKESKKKTELLAKPQPKPKPESKPEPEPSSPTPTPSPPSPPPADTDGDGLTDLEELEVGSNPKVIDTDLDGLDDYTEVKIYHSDPGKRDTDGDGYDDGTEVENGYSPIGSGRL